MGNTKNKQIFCKNLSEDEFRQISMKSGYSMDRIKAYYQSFISDCPKGKLSKRNFRKMYRQLYPNSKSNKFCDRIFKIFDKNNDDYLDFNEFLTAITVTLNGTCIDKLRCAFEIYDLKGDGVLDRHEMKMILRHIYDMLGEDGMKNNTNKKVDLIFEKFDSNKNELTLQEFIQGCLKDEYLAQLFENNEKIKYNLDSLETSCSSSACSSSTTSTASSQSYSSYSTKTKFSNRKSSFLSFMSK